MDIVLDNLEGFIWDERNQQKSLTKHGVPTLEAEEAFFNLNILSPDLAHRQSEPRYRLLGQANNGRILLIVFTIRSNKARIISSRLANKKGASMPKKLKAIPKFKKEAEEARFWQTHDSTQYVDWSKAPRGVFPNLKPSSQSISLRIPAYILARIKMQANKLDVPYQTLMKQYIAKEVLKN